MVTYFRLLPVGLRLEVEYAWDRKSRAVEEVANLEYTTRNGSQVLIKPKQGRKPNRGYEEGVAAEERFFTICARYQELGRFPSWHLGVIRGTVDDDVNGIDFHARILGARERRYRVPIQIKSSEAGKHKFRSNPKRRHIPCIIVNDWYSDEQIFTITL